MTMKEQLTGAKKGFTPKWSREVYVVKRKSALPGNPNNFRYSLYGERETYFRHELLKVPKQLDSDTMDFISHLEKEGLEEEEYNPLDDM